MKPKRNLLKGKDYTDNPYFNNNPDNFLALIDLISKNRNQYYQSLTATGGGYKCKNRPYKERKQPPYRYLGIWIEELLPILNDPLIKMSTKVKWILDGRTCFPKCAVCGKDDYYRTYNVSFGYDYPRTCSISCQNNDPLRKQNLIRSNRLVYGYDWPKQNPNIQLRDESALTGLYGVTNVFQLNSVKEKSRLTNINNHNNPNWRNAEQISKTRLMFSPEKKDEILNSFKKTCLNALGVEFPSQSEEIRKQSALSYFKKTGYWHPMQNPDVVKKHHLRYEFEGENFDSSNELAFFIYARDHNLPIVHLTDVRIEYEFNSRTYYYFPDFFNLNDKQIIEIKGSQFFSPDGKMTCPYRNPVWTDEQYKNRCRKEEAKHQCMINANVLIIRTDSSYMKSVMKYIYKKYAPNYIESFRNIKA